MGQSPPGKTVLEWEGEPCLNSGLPFVQGNAEFGRKFPRPVKWCLKPAKTADSDTFLISVRAPVGQTSRVDQRLAIGRGLAAIRFTNVDKSYGWHAINQAKDALQRIAQGSTFKAIGSRDLGTLHLPFPPLAEQRAIAAVLDSIDETIERTEGVITANEQLREAARDKLFTRGLPGWHSKWKKVPWFGMVPTEWDVVRLGEVARVIGGTTPSRAKEEYWGGDIPWVVPSDLSALFGRFLASTRESITSVGMKAAGLRVIPAGSVLLTSRATIGAAAINTVPVVTNQGFQNLVVKKGTHSLWLFYCISAIRRELERRASGSTFREISRANVRSLPICLPSLPEQEAIARTLDSIDSAIETSQVTREALTNVKASTAEALLTGRKRVPVEVGR